MFLRKCISILPGITLSEKRAAGASRFGLTERFLLALHPTPQDSDHLHTRNCPDKGIFQMLQSASRRILAEVAVLALCRSSHTSFPWVSLN